MTRWLVTGAGGQLATAFEPLLDGEVALHSHASLDVCDADALCTAVHAFAPDVILHAAAYTNVDGAEGDPGTAEAVNVGGARNVMRAVSGTHTRVVYFSSDYVFSGAKGEPYVESDGPGPLGVYGRTKLAGEAEVLRSPGGMVVRTSWLFSETGVNFAKTILGAAAARRAAGDPLRVVDDQVGSPTYAGHLAAAVIEALRSGVGPGLYHMAGSGYCSWLEFACELVALAGIDSTIEPTTTAELGRPAARPAFSALATERQIPRLPHWVDGVAIAVDRLLGLG